ncbi:hypothetical protein Plec18167_006245 [Paecilomyces lecythidis]|uniref:Uncharacterized protein n=1 Tax=Paecilomyces lecythidis TaxID=3004212 RepID=A0ABR3XDE5_9EURO
MKFFSVAFMGLVASSFAAPEPAATSSSATPTTSHKPDIAQPIASDNSPIDAFVQCLWPTTDRIVGELAGLSDLSFNKFIDEVHWEVIWWGDPSKWVPDLVGLGLNATFVTACLLETVGEGVALTTTDLFNEFLKTFDLIPRNASNTAVPGLR